MHVHMAHCIQYAYVSVALKAAASDLQYRYDSS